MAQTSKLETFLRTHHLSDDEAVTLLKGTKEKPSSLKPLVLGGKKHDILMISDTHCGHKCYNPKIMDHAAKVAQECDYVVHIGDIIEGHYESRRPGHVFELTHIGADAQTKYAAEELKKLGKPLYFITGNHCKTVLKIAGVDIGERLQELVPNSHHLGVQSGSLEFAHGRKLELVHPDGGISYALSYKPQKMIEAYEGGTKPDVLAIGNYHKTGYFMYRNVHAFLAGTLEHQTPFMKNLGIAAHVGFWKLSFTATKNGINAMTPTWYPVM